MSLLQGLCNSLSSPNFTLMYPCFLHKLYVFQDAIKSYCKQSDRDDMSYKLFVTREENQENSTYITCKCCYYSSLECKCLENYCHSPGIIIIVGVVVRVLKRLACLDKNFTLTFYTLIDSCCLNLVAGELSCLVTTLVVVLMNQISKRLHVLILTPDFCSNMQHNFQVHIS